MLCSSSKIALLILLFFQLFLFPFNDRAVTQNEIKFTLLQNWNKSITLIDSKTERENIIVLTFVAQEDYLIWAVLKQGDVKLTNKNFTFVEQSICEFVVKCFFPEKGDYILSLFLKAKGAKGAFTEAVRFSFSVSSDPGQIFTFPQYINFSIADYIPDYDFGKIGKIPLDYNFENIDSYARNVPDKYAGDINSLTGYLTRNSKNDMEKVRAFFIWITDNISYDTDGYFSGKTKESGDYDYALKYKKSVCSGYSSLFLLLCKEAEIKCVEISGFVKGYGYNQSLKPEKKSNHSWNAVEVDGAWYFIDATWGAGFISDRKKFVKKFKEYFFLISPSNLIFTHFPLEAKFQFLPNPVSWEDFLNWPKVSSYALSSGIKPKSESFFSSKRNKGYIITINYLSEVDLLININGKSSFKEVYKSHEIHKLLKFEEFLQKHATDKPLLVGKNPVKSELYLIILDVSRFESLDFYIKNPDEASYNHGIRYSLK